MTEITIPQIKQALDLAEFDAVEAQMMMMPEERRRQRPPERSGSARLGGVLALLYFREDHLHIVLTKRRDDLNSHAGQVSFPGGKNEKPESLLATALRETEEEIGISAGALEVLGTLDSLYIPPSDYEVHPYVAWYENGLTPTFKANPQEVAEIIEVPLVDLLDPGIRAQGPWDFQGHRIFVPYFAINGHKVWGATAMMLSELVERLRLIVMDS